MEGERGDGEWCRKVGRVREMASEAARVRKVAEGKRGSGRWATCGEKTL